MCDFSVPKFSVRKLPTSIIGAIDRAERRSSVEIPLFEPMHGKSSSQF